MRPLVATALACAALACSGSPGRAKPVVLVETEPAPDAGPPGVADGALEERLAGDLSEAAAEIRNALESPDVTAAAWAAVYARRLGLKHDADRSRRALLNGVKSEDPLLASLSWRWLSTDREAAELPPWPDGRSVDPAVATMSAAVLAGRRQLPRALQSALGLPEQDPKREVSPPAGTARHDELLRLTLPYDNGPLAAAIYFVEARRGGWTERDARGRPGWIAARLRDELLRALGRDQPEVLAAVARSRPSASTSHSPLAGAVENPLINNERRRIRSAALAGPAALRIGALRALASVALRPEVGDLGAAAAALESEQALIRLEGARTLLLLAARATREEP